MLGLKPCGLPSCGKQEASVSHFKNCSRYEAVKYCCHEHLLAHWPVHQTQCDALGRERRKREHCGGAA